MAELFLIAVVLLLFSLTPQESDGMDALAREKTQMLKGITAVLIVFGHCSAIDRSSALCRLNVGWYGVALFMFISGWGITYCYKYRSNYLQHFWSSRFFKIIIPFFSAHIIYLFIKSAYGMTFSLREIIAGLLGQCTVVDNSWYPVAIIAFYFLFWIAFQLHVPEYIKPALIMLAVLISTFIQFKLFSLARDWWFISNFAFSLGVVLAFCDSHLVYRKYYLCIATVGYILGYCMVPGFHILLGNYNDNVYILASNFRSGFLSALIVLLASYFKPDSKIMRALGQISYEIYLIHGLFIFIFSHYTNRVMPIFVLTLGCSIFTSYFLNIFHSKVTNKLQRCFK